MISIILSNASRSILSHDLVGETARELNVDIVITTEPNLGTAARHDWLADAVGDVAITIISNRIGWQLHHRGKGILAIILPNFVLVAGYVSPNIGIAEYELYIDEIQRVILQSPKRAVVMGDFNCKATIAGSSYTNRRGQIFTEMMMATDMICLNDDSYTFEARGHRSVLDLTLVDNSWDPSHYQWRVLRSKTGSDHFATIFSFDGIRPVIGRTPKPPRLSKRQVEVVVDKVARKLMDGREVTPFLQELINGIRPFLILQELIVTEMARIPQNIRVYQPAYW
ncbi:uncharacterized protein LOC142322701 [Lycorma delicatula]|uniref:uncharacterized protein LOC142322701 n=1 Tax=Lycorma delicatula TaxID=130591 RepID=UPI003F510FED